MTIAPEQAAAPASTSTTRVARDSIINGGADLLRLAVEAFGDIEAHDRARDLLLATAERERDAALRQVRDLTDQLRIGAPVVVTDQDQDNRIHDLTAAPVLPVVTQMLDTTIPTDAPSFSLPEPVHFDEGEPTAAPDGVERSSLTAEQEAQLRTDLETAQENLRIAERAVAAAEENDRQVQGTIAAANRMATEAREEAAREVDLVRTAAVQQARQDLVTAINAVVKINPEMPLHESFDLIKAALNGSTATPRQLPRPVVALAS